MKITEPPLRELVLIGGGHAHVQVVRRFAMQPEPGVRITLISREGASPYTGMLPGFVAGEYQAPEIVIDLQRLTRFPQCRFIEATVEQIDIGNQSVLLSGDRSPFRYDALSINVGGDCALNLPGGELAAPLKPIGQFLQRWPSILDRVQRDTESVVAIIGGGPGSVEFALALRQRIGDATPIVVLTRSKRLVPRHGRRARRSLERALIEHQIKFLCDFEVVRLQQSDVGSQIEIINANESSLLATSVFSATGVAGPAFLQQSGFSTDDAGFLKVNSYLQSESATNVFGAGDAVALVGQIRPKSGVYSVRAGPVLAENLRRFLLQQPLKRFRAQRKSLALMRTAPALATASRGLVQISGKSMWRVKDYIDRRFMRRFQELPTMTAPQLEYRGELQSQAPSMAMRCGGCGAKLGADILQRTLHRLDIHEPEFVVTGIGDDAALANLGSYTLAITCDGFRAMIDDSWRFGRIAAHHALNDLYAMNSTPSVAIALASVPLMADHLMEEELYQILSGALSVFNESNIALVGGHSAEGAELTLGFTVIGTTHYLVMRKSNLMPSQALVLTKPLGVGAILAGAMDGRCSAEALSGAIAIMDQSNARASEVFSDYDVNACTDITGFGLIGHLGEMLRASGVSATVYLDSIPSLREGLLAIHNGVESSLQVNNEQAFSDCHYECSSRDPRLRILADPQTSGGLLGGVELEYVDQCIANLHSHGYEEACVIGYIDRETIAPGTIVIKS